MNYPLTFSKNKNMLLKIKNKNKTNLTIVFFRDI